MSLFPWLFRRIVVEEDAMIPAASNNKGCQLSGNGLRHEASVAARTVFKQGHSSDPRHPTTATARTPVSP